MLEKINNIEQNTTQKQSPSNEDIFKTAENIDNSKQISNIAQKRHTKD